MCIAAHPDDEDGTSLIVMRHKYGAHTVSLFSTFGEGGQNAIGPELYEELGAIRARETMAAAEIQGSEPHFLGLKDFGYSKSAEEAFRVWGHDEALRRMVLQIRKLRPDVIITNHSVANNDHGHHQATARLEVEAFDAAADPKRFPEQLKDGVTVWQVQRLFVRAGRSSEAQADNAPTVTIDPNESDPVRGKVYAKEALEALHKHATQGPWPETVAQMAARFTNSSDVRLPIIRYRLVREAKGAGAALTKDSHNFLDGLKLAENIEKELHPPVIEGQPLTNFVDQRPRVFDALDTESHTGVPLDYQNADSQRFERFSANWERALGLAANVTLDLETSPKVVTPGSPMTVTFKVTNRGPRSGGIFGCVASIPSLAQPIHANKSVNISYHGDPLNAGSTVERSQRIQIPAETIVNVPLSKHLYDNSVSELKVDATCSVFVSKSLFNVEMPTQVDVAPPVQIEKIIPSPVVLTPLNFERMDVNNWAVRPVVFSVRLINHQPMPFKGNLNAAGSVVDKRANSVAIKLAPGQSKTFTMVLNPPAAGSMTFSLSDGKISAPPKQIPVFTALARVSPNLRVGYIRGFDYSLPNALASLGVESTELSVEEVKKADLQKYSSIIIDNRVYESQPELIAANQRLLDYTKNGGTLIVFYHKSNEWNPDERRKRPQLAPYKLILGDERITDETAPVTFIEPQHPLLNTPNKIGPDDFANWIQERGLYYPKDWDPQFHALLQSNDPGEAPLKGGLLVADYGRGHYIYTSMVWYRELRAGVPGAYRMLANMISYGRPPR
ncbi:MAG: hypothetical protein QOD75_382 [Blastocatellia bacterium]|nr:hypothetical protein [Blastocatellia bacterium]